MQISTTATAILPAHILVVDDEVNLCKLLADVLRRKYRVETAYGVAEARKLLAEHSFDLCVTDLRLPDGSGIEILQQAKKNDPSMEVIIITAHASLDTAISAVNLGAASYLQKPVSLADFSAQAEKALANREFTQRSKHVADSLGSDSPAQEHFSNITHLYELSRKLMLFLDVADIMKAILQELSERLGALVCTVGINLFGTSEIHAMARAEGMDAEQLKTMIEAHWEAAFGVLDKKEFSRERAALTSYAFTGERVDGSDAVGISMIPLIVLGRTIGSIAAYCPAQRAITTSEYQFMHVFSSLAGPLIENCYIHRRTKLQALTDGLTGVANHRAFQEMLSREIARADRDRGEFCLCIMDLDHFKKVNDTWGHQVGDAILRDVPAHINPNIRDGDILARYGGEEFALILPNTTLEGAFVLSERIRQSIAQNPYPLEEEQISYTISIGISVYNGKSPRKKEELIKDADDALYISKMQGRNRITASE